MTFGGKLGTPLVLQGEALVCIYIRPKEKPKLTFHYKQLINNSFHSVTYFCTGVNYPPLYQQKKKKKEFVLAINVHHSPYICNLLRYCAIVNY